MRRRKQKPSLAHLELRKTQVQNPDWRRDLDGVPGFPRMVTASVNIRESAIATLAAKGVLNAAQVAAADRFRQLCERMGSGVRTVDYAREPVDGGRSADPVSATQLAAGKELKRCRDLLGAHGYGLVRQIAGERRSLHEFCATRRERETAADMLRIHLDALAELWRLQTKRG